MIRSLLLPLLTTVMLTADPAAASTVLTFVPPSGEVRCDEEIDIEIRVDAGAVDLRGLSITLQFDAGLLDLVDVFAGQLFEDAPCDPFLYWTASSTGVVQIDVAGLGCSVDGPGAVARIRVRGIADGLSPLAGLASTLRTSTNAPISATWTNGILLVSCPVGTEPISFGTLKALLR